MSWLKTYPDHPLGRARAVIDTCQRGKVIISFDRLLRFAFSEDMTFMWRNTHGHGVKINHQSMQRITACVGSCLFHLKTMLHQDVTTCNVAGMFEISHTGDQPGPGALFLRA